MTAKQIKSISKFLSLVLRHKPETIGLKLDENGWTSVQDLLEKMKGAGKVIDFETLTLVVENNDKKRFAFNEDRTLLRANQGHSIAIELDYAPVVPPAILYHGTAERNLDSIFESGLDKRQRHHVHLSTDQKTAKTVGSRYGKPIVLAIATLQMHQDGFIFYQSKNGVWLTEEVPVKYINKSEIISMYRSEDF